MSSMFLASPRVFFPPLGHPPDGIYLVAHLALIFPLVIMRLFRSSALMFCSDRSRMLAGVEPDQDLCFLRFEGVGGVRSLSRVGFPQGFEGMKPLRVGRV